MGESGADFGDSLSTGLRAPVRVLVVDDNAIHRTLATTVLEDWGIDTAVALDGAEAVQLMVEGYKFDLILMDVHMPVMDGITATGNIREYELAHGRLQHHRVPIVAFTTEDLRTDDAHLRSLGLDDVVPKPFTASQVMACLRRWCREKFEPE